jgi:threonine aldolase
MRQAGIIAAGGLYAMKNNVERLKVDHFHAKQLEQTLVNLPWVEGVMPVETNIVVTFLKDPEKRDIVIAKLAEHGIRIMAFGEGMLRMVTHIDIKEAAIEKTCETLKMLKV